MFLCPYSPLRLHRLLDLLYQIIQETAVLAAQEIYFCRGMFKLFLRTYTVLSTTPRNHWGMNSTKNDVDVALSCPHVARPPGCFEPFEFLV
jgi:hypothetical protein